MGEMNLKFDRNSTLQPARRSDSFSLSDYYSDNDNGNGVEYKEDAKIAQYRRAIQLIDRKCELLSRNNEKLVRRIHYVKSISKRKEKDILLLKARLDEYNDEWRTADTSDTASNNFPSLIRTSAQSKSKKSTTRKYKKNADNANNSKNDGAITNGSVKDASNKSTESKGRKRQKLVKEQSNSKRPPNQFSQQGPNHQQQ
ncbi:hypothetical protein Bhyg_00573 [Pseudolycoriella hygida]|uniref:Uncharacterized protein n=1 Tax=Pseudolycoriella hygida TaxID=35572 RepID=A0A9Q0S4Q9_9DIPT|nr:hypothetical protein Bhyg_00573 [Pseudolycoriella hygida]